MLYLLLTLTIFHSFCSVTIVVFEQVNVSWAGSIFVGNLTYCKNWTIQSRFSKLFTDRIFYDVQSNFSLFVTYMILSGFPTIFLLAGATASREQREQWIYQVNKISFFEKNCSYSPVAPLQHHGKTAVLYTKLKFLTNLCKRFLLKIQYQFNLSLIKVPCKQKIIQSWQ